MWELLLRKPRGRWVGTSSTALKPASATQWFDATRCWPLADEVYHPLQRRLAAISKQNVRRPHLSDLRGLKLFTRPSRLFGHQLPLWLRLPQLQGSSFTTIISVYPSGGGVATCKTISTAVRPTNKTTNDWCTSSSDFLSPQPLYTLLSQRETQFSDNERRKTQVVCVSVCVIEVLILYRPSRKLPCIGQTRPPGLHKIEHEPRPPAHLTATSSFRCLTSPQKQMSAAPEDETHELETSETKLVPAVQSSSASTTHKRHGRWTRMAVIDARQIRLLSLRYMRRRVCCEKGYGRCSCPLFSATYDTISLRATCCRAAKLHFVKRSRKSNIAHLERDGQAPSSPEQN